MVSKVKTKMLYDVVYVLDRSEAQPSKISEYLDEIGLIHQKIKATDGSNIIINNLATGKKFTGLDIKNNNITTDRSSIYEVICDANIPRDSFTLIGKTVAPSADDFSAWCNYRLIWKDIVIHNYQHSVALIGNFAINFNNFTHQLNQLLPDLPKNYDITYLDASPSAIEKIPLFSNSSVSKFSENAGSYSTGGAIYSNNFARKMLDIKSYTSTIDDFTYWLTKNKASVLNFKPLEVYLSTSSLLISDEGQSAPIMPKMLYDVAYLINLDRATDRLANMEKRLAEIGIPYKIFKAVDGYSMSIKNLQTGQEFTGQDLKDKTVLMSKNIVYQVTCNPDEYYKFILNIQAPLKQLSAGEIGLWCTHYIIAHEMVWNNYKNVVVFEDDIRFDTQNFTENLNHFIGDLPPSYDIGYLGIDQRNGTKIPFELQNHISKFSNDSVWYCTWGMVLSNQFAKKLLSDTQYVLSLDDYLLNIFRGYVPKPYNLEIYAATKDLIFYDGAPSEIENMGRVVLPTTNTGHPYDIVLVLNLDRSPARWDRVSKHLDELGVNYQRFSAIDGYNVQIIDKSNNISYTGLDITNHKFMMQVGGEYIINCNPTSASPTWFPYTAGMTLIAGEVGVLCSYVQMWTYIATKGLQRAIILEDDFVAKTKNFAQTLDYFILDVPADYDIAYIDVRQRARFNGPEIFDAAQRAAKKVPLRGHEYVSKFKEGSNWDGLWATMYSAKGATKLLQSTDKYFATADVYISELDRQHKLDVYISSIELAGHEGHSEICDMGLKLGHTCLT